MNTHNCPEVVNQLVNENFGLARYWAGKQEHWHGYDEALSIAMEGLLRAAQKWRVETGLKFGTFASICIRWRFQNAHHKKLALRRGPGIWHESLDARVHEDGSTTLGDVVADENAQQAAESIYSEERKREAQELLGLLSVRDRRIVELRFGLNCERPMLLEEIGQMYRISRERVRQIEAAALRKFWRVKQRKGLVAVTAADLQRVA